jgi:hypothetical protein
MDEQKLIKLLKENFSTKEDHKSLRNEILEFKTETQKSFYDINTQLRGIRTELKEMGENINELKPSAKSLDEILVQYPIERIERLEKHSKLPKFVPVLD